MRISLVLTPLSLSCSLKDEEDQPVVSDKDLAQMVSGCGNVRTINHINDFASRLTSMALFLMN